MIKRITLTIIILLLIPSPTHAREGSDQLNNPFDQPQPTDAAEEPTPEPAPPPEQQGPDSILPVGLPWAAGQNDAGYCPMRYGWGWTGRLRWPVDGYTDLRPFGYFPGGQHGGLDLSVPFGTAVYAPTNGTIVWSGGNSTGFGNRETGLVAIASSGRVILLAHLSDIVEGLDCGDAVTAGQLVGYSGGPGYGAASWEHLHMGVRWQGLDWNPKLWMD